MKNFERLLQYAKDAHAEVNHKYDDKEYGYHLDMACDVGREFLYLIPSEDQEDVMCAIALHDTIEDCRKTYNDILKISNRRVADIVFALSNEKGKTRSERANSKYYKDMIVVQYARFAKLCDRVANVKYSKDKRSRMFGIYHNECCDFVSKLFPNQNLIKTYQPNVVIRIINYVAKFFKKHIPVMEYEKLLLEKLVYLFPAEQHELLVINHNIQNTK